MATYYVTQAGAGTADGTSLENAYSVAGHNAATFAAGDTVIVAGTITTVLDPPSNGSPGNLIIYRPVIFGGTTVNVAAATGVDLTVRQYVKVQDLIVQNSTIRGIYINAASNITIDGCTVHDCGTHGIHVDQECTDITITNNTCYKSGSSSPLGGQIYVSPRSGDAGARVVISGNTCYHELSEAKGRYGIAVYPLAGGSVDDCKVFDNTCYGNYFAGIDIVNNVINCVVRNNVVYGNRLTGIHLGGTSGTDKVTGALVFKNTVSATVLANSDGVGILFDDYTTTSVARANLIFDNEETGIKINNCQDHTFEGNITYGNGANALKFTGGTSGNKILNNTLINSGGTGAAIFADGAAGGATTETIKNNIIVSDGSGFEVTSGGDLTSTYNCINAATTYTGTVADKTGDITVDPQLDANYAPQNSAVKAAGTWIAGVRGYDDLPLPIHPDIGAVQDRDFPGRRFGAVDGDGDE